MRAAMPVVSRSLVALVIAAAATGAVVAHGTIDIIADYLVAHASYDDVSSHDSRGLVVAIAAMIAGAVALHGLRLCCDAAAHRTLASSPAPSWRSAPLFVGATMLLASLAVPAMELLDSRLAGTTLAGLDDAFGGSVLLGLSTTLVCAAAVAIAVFAFARWILSHRDRIIAAIVGIIRFRSQAYAGPRRSRSFTGAPICPRRLSALRRGKRAPPSDALRHPKTSLTHCEGIHASNTRRGVLPLRRQRPHPVRRSDCAGATDLSRSEVDNGVDRCERYLLGPASGREIRSHGRC
ncbi:MAG TPA: hypothetical protein VNU22_09155 [Candidatus Acidoferrum sp.]|nr:hypothetical protein [Candidatus Acidoferrum sp.]